MSKSEFRALLAVAVVAIAIRLAVSAAFKGHSYVAAEPVKPETEATYLKRGEIGLGDSEQYLLLGDGIRHLLSYGWDGEPNTFRTPGYPLLLACCHKINCTLLQHKSFLFQCRYRVEI